MQLYELLVVAVSLSMDAFAVSVCKGLSTGRSHMRHSMICGIWFGMFQALMPLLGWFLGVQFQKMIVSIDHWIAFVLLGLIGFNMIREAVQKEEDIELDSSFSPKAMLPLAVATSIDALAVGITFAFLQVDILPAISFIGIITFTMSAIGVRIGATFGAKYQSLAELVGGIILIGMGVKILLEHTLLS